MVLYRQIRNLKGEEATLIRQDERLGRAMSKTAMVSATSSSTYWRGEAAAAERVTDSDESEVMVSS